jgi:uncharacterized protein YdaU (DUF1376 family)
MQKLPYLKFYPSDFLGGVMHLSAGAIGVYIQLLCWQWLYDAFAIDEVTCGRIPGLREHWPEVQCKFQQRSDGRWFNARMEDERRQAFALSEKRANAGKSGASSRWTNGKGNGKCHAVAIGNANGIRAYETILSSGSFSGEGSAEGRGLAGSSSASYLAARDPDCERVWQQVPANWRRAPGKARPLIYDAIRSIAAGSNLTIEAAADLLGAACGAYCRSREGKGSFRRTLVRWLEERGWEEDPSAWIVRAKTDEKPGDAVLRAFGIDPDEEQTA